LKTPAKSLWKASAPWRQHLKALAATWSNSGEVRANNWFAQLVLGFIWTKFKQFRIYLISNYFLFFVWFCSKNF
jgi:hypothetical protein